jgi:hypothetical protein
MIEVGDAVGGSDRKLPIDFPPQPPHTSRKVLQVESPFSVSLKLPSPPSSIDGMRYFRQAWAALLAALLCAAAAACGIPHDVGLADRCADIMRRAYPSAAIDITKSEASATSLTTITAQVEGVRTDLPPDAALPRDLAVECRFDENVLTGFRWTVGPTVNPGR